MSQLVWLGSIATVMIVAVGAWLFSGLRSHGRDDQGAISSSWLNEQRTRDRDNDPNR